MKFKLTKLGTANIRYEIIYKNLLRDLRKFYANDFKDKTEYNAKKREDYGELLELYIHHTFGKKLTELQIPMKEMITNLGSFVNPKATHKLLEKDDFVN